MELPTLVVSENVQLAITCGVSRCFLLLLLFVVNDTWCTIVPFPTARASIGEGDGTIPIEAIPLLARRGLDVVKQIAL